MQTADFFTNLRFAHCFLTLSIVHSGVAVNKDNDSASV